MASSRSVTLPALAVSSSSSSSMLLRRTLLSALPRPQLPSSSPAPFLRRAFAGPSLPPAVAVPVPRHSGPSPLLLPSPVRQSFFGRAPSASAPPSPPPPSVSMSALSSTGIEDARRSPFVPLPPSDTADKVELYKRLEAAIGSPFSSDPSVPHPNPQILVISGPSGVGKDAVIKRLQEVREEIHFVVTATSRPQRPGEIDGKDYYFVTKEEFLLMIERNELLEYALVYGDYKGIPKQQIRDYMTKGYDIVLRVDIQGAATLRSILGDSAVFIFLVAESEEALVKRLVARKTETSEMLLVRISTAREEMKHMKNFDYVVINAEGKLDSAVKLIESIIDAEKARVQQRDIKV